MNITVKLKYLGDYYSNYFLRVQLNKGNKYISLSILDSSKTELETLTITKENLQSIWDSSKFLEKPSTKVLLSLKDLINEYDMDIVKQNVLAESKSNLFYKYSTTNISQPYLYDNSNFSTLENRNILNYKSFIYYQGKNYFETKFRYNKPDGSSVFNKAESVFLFKKDTEDFVCKLTKNDFAKIVFLLNSHIEEDNTETSLIIDSPLNQTQYELRIGESAENCSKDIQNTILYNSLAESNNTDSPFKNISKEFLKLKNRLEYPLDVYFDGSSNWFMKSLILSKLASLRTDCHFFMDIFDGTRESVEMNSAKVAEANNNILENIEADSDSANTEFKNVSFYYQYFTIKNPLNQLSQIVGPTYYLSMMIPYNENTYGIWAPCAGLKYGKLPYSAVISDTPTENLKDTLYESKINYIEKDVSGLAFMSQLTRDSSATDAQYTSLSFVSNSRTIEKIQKDIEFIGRNHIFEFNDSIELQKYKLEVEEYLNQYVQERILKNDVYVSVEKNKFNDNAIDTKIFLSFVGFIEQIEILINID